MAEEMDRGAFIANGYTVEPGINGSFIVVQGGVKWRSDGYLASMHGFSDYLDLLAWLADEHKVLAKAAAGASVAIAEKRK